MSFEEYFQPPFSVFFLWAVFLGIIVLFHPIRQIVMKICQLLGCACCAEEEGGRGDADEERGFEGARHGDYYGHLSAERKTEIDNLRSMALLKYLANFTLTLKEEHMTTREPTQHKAVDSVREEKTPESDDKNNAIENGFPNEDEEEAKVEIEEEAKLEIREYSGEYTHVLIPPAGQNIDGTDVKVDKSPTEDKRSSLWHLINKTPQDKTSNSETTTKSIASNATEKRAVPIFCAVCLMEYEISERVCWSSNSECTHVFHEDCIVQWLVSSGRTKSKRQWFPENPSERRLMCYDLECPCCRQAFISKEARVENPDENV